MPAGFLTPRRFAIGALCVLSVIVCCGLAWWQWDRFESASGTFQNLGYVLQWPLFGLFPAFMVLRIRKLRRKAAEADREQAAHSGQEWAQRAVPRVPAPRPVSAPAPPPRRVVVHEDDDDDELAAYNRYLAELHARDQQDR